jgi:hypothetical protein
VANVAELIVKIVADTKDAQSGVDDVATKTSKMGAGIRSAAAPAAVALAAVGAAAVSAAKAAAEDEQAQAILASTMKNTTGASDAQVASMEDYISKMTLATGVADDQLRPAMGNLLRATGDAAKAQEAMEVAMDVSAATGKDLGSVTEGMAKAYGGNAGALKRLVPTLSDAAIESGNMKKIMGELSEQTGGAMAASADTAAGKMEIFQNSMSEAQEEAGTALIPVLTTMAELFVDVAKWIGENTTLFLVIAGAIAAIAAAILVANAALTIYTTVTTIAGIVSAASWGAALLPILLVIAAVVLVVGAVVLLWKKSETFRGIVTGVWNGVKAAIDAVIDTVGRLITRIGNISVPGIIKAAFDTIRNAVENAWDWVGRLINKITSISVPGLIKEGFNLIRSAVESAWNWVGNLITKIGNITVPGFIATAFSTIKTAVEGAWNKVGDLIGAIGRISIPGVFASAFDTLAGAIGRVVDAVQNLIGWLGRIKVPSINLPGPFMAPPPPATVATATYASPAVASPRATASSSSPTYSIVVNGAIDPEATARQIRRILAGHDRRVGLA